MTLAESLRYWMEDRSIRSLNALSNQSEVPYGTLRDMSKGITENVGLTTLKALARVLDITLDELVEGPSAQKEKAPAQNEQELSPKLKQIIGLLPYTPETIQDAILAICAQTADQTQVDKALQRDGQWIRERKALSDSYGTEEEQSG